jgi:hypothetical protein
VRFALGLRTYITVMTIWWAIGRQLADTLHTPTVLILVVRDHLHRTLTLVDWMVLGHKLMTRWSLGFLPRDLLG